jgi:hypothetical protein
VYASVRFDPNQFANAVTFVFIAVIPASGQAERLRCMPSRKYSGRLQNLRHGLPGLPS